MADEVRGELNLGTSGWDAALGAAEQTADKFVTNLEHGVGKRINHIFGLGLMLEIVSVGRELIKSGAELDALARKNDITVETLQKLQHFASANGQSFDELAESVRNAGGSLREFAATNEQVQKSASAVDITGQEGFGLSETTHFGNRVMRFLKALGTKAAANSDLARVANIASFLTDRSAFEQRFTQSFPQAGTPIFGIPNLGAILAQTMFSGPRTAIEHRFQADRPQTNQLQQIGAFSAREQGITDIRKIVNVLVDISGGIKKVVDNTKTDSTSYELLP